MKHVIRLAAAWLLLTSSALAQFALTLPDGTSTSTASQSTYVPLVSTVPLASTLLAPVTSTLTRPGDTTPYAAGDLFASSTTAGSVVVPSFTIPVTGVIIPRIRIRTNATTGWATTLNLRLWSAAPTYTNGDNGGYAVATGSAARLAQYSCTLEQFGDGASGTCAPTVGTAAFIRTAGTSVWWDLAATAAVTPISSQTFTITPEIVQ